MSASWDAWDVFCMQRALQLARLGEGHVEPNPMVGCVVSLQGRIVGEGYHASYGGPHAEVIALQQAGPAATGATLYVTLEPCCHWGKTPPCTDAILAAKIQRVVVACYDPFPQVRGNGLQILRAAGVQVEVGLCAQDAAHVLAPYLTRLSRNRPWIIAKYAMTWDGKIATATGQSRWISNEKSRQAVHKLRGRVDAIAVGWGTVQQDDPRLLAEPPGPRRACRVVFDSQARLSCQSQLVHTVDQAPVCVVASEDAPASAVERLRAAGCQVWLGPKDSSERLQGFLRFQAQQGVTNFLVEGGARLLGAFFDADLIDEIHLFLCPKLVGGQNAPSPIGGRGIPQIEQARGLTIRHIEWFDEDAYLISRAVRNPPLGYIDVDPCDTAHGEKPCGT